ncbi:hypothetical protein [Bradyrhizobium neotropicale]|uniref:hypothetical protein n=1 Tax=Bradyrhizobium neotropicale TaxID=1497615 RepID=UPI001AD73BD1|nr:hypothetical protein [Bradyrhizobium neotropicale]MBO4224572.1 hypothetical protein [Bradyrhizobium neotropicale]
MIAASFLLEAIEQQRIFCSMLDDDLGGELDRFEEPRLSCSGQARERDVTSKLWARDKTSNALGLVFKPLICRCIS